MKDAESTPSPNRFCRKLGMRNAALKASGGVGLESEVMREDALPDQADDAAEQNARADQERVAAGALALRRRH